MAVSGTHERHTNDTQTSYWTDNNFNHVMSKSPDAKTLCGLTALAAQTWFMARADAMPGNLCPTCKAAAADLADYEAFFRA